MRTNGKSALADRGSVDAGMQRGMRTVRFEPNLASEWDEFVNRSKNGTLFHSRRFLSYHPQDRFEDYSYMAYDGDRLVAVYPAAIQVRGAARWWCSHPGSTYGGPVVAPDAGIEEIARVLETLADLGREAGFAGMEMRLSEQAFRARPADEIEFCLWRAGFQVKAAELSTTIPLMDGYQASVARFREDTGRNVRKAARLGVEVSWSDDFETYWGVLEQNLARHGTHPTHSLPEILRLRDLCPGKIRLALARVQGVAAAGVVVFVANGVCFHSFYIAQDYAQQQTRALSAVFDFLIRWGCEERFRYFNLGISTEQAGTVVNWGLFTFKQGFGGSGYLRTTYSLPWSA